MKQNKNSVIVRIILWTLTALILLGVLLWGLELLPGLSIRGLSFGGWDFHYKDSAQYQVGSGSVSAAGLRSLEVNWVDGSVHLEVTDGDSVVFREPDGLDEEDQLRFQVVGDRLIIQYSKPRWGFGFHASQPDKHLTVEIPRTLAGQLVELQVDTVSAPAKKIKLTADTVSGGLQLSGQANSVEFDGVSGGMDLALLQVPRKVSTDTISGNIHLTLPQDAAFSVELDSASGKLDNEFSSTKTGDIYYCGQGGGTFQFDSVSGDVVIRMAR